jgi:ABC-type amino acid transport substrate-binding protein
MHARGVLRVGYLADSLPFAFVNARGDLVGFDIEMAHIFAGDLGLPLELAPISRAGLAADLDGATSDLAMSGIAVTTDRAAQMAFSASYLDETLAFIVPDNLRDRFSRWDSIRTQGPLRLGVPPLPTYIAKIQRELPDAQLTPIDSVDQLFVGKTLAFDALVLTAERGSAWTLLHPQYSVAVPLPQPIKVPLAYPVAAHDEAFAKLVSTWIELKQKDGTIDALFAHWILGRDASPRQPRWSVIRNVMHWVA